MELDPELSCRFGNGLSDRRADFSTLSQGGIEFPRYDLAKGELDPTTEGFLVLLHQGQGLSDASDRELTNETDLDWNAIGGQDSAH